MPLLTAVFVVLGALVGIARGGRLYRMAENVPRAWPLLPFGVALILQSGHPGLPGAHWFQLVGYLYLLLFAVANLRRTFGAVVLLIGVLANGSVIAANERMPYQESAAISVGMYDKPADLSADHPTREWETDDTKLAPLDRRYGVEPTHEAVSLGDLMTCLAAAWFAMYLLLPSRRLSRLRPVEYRMSAEERAARRRSARRSRRARSALTPLDPADAAYSHADISIPDEPGPEEPGPYQFGPQQFGPQHFGPEEVGLDRPGRRSSSYPPAIPDYPPAIPDGWVIDESAFRPDADTAPPSTDPAATRLTFPRQVESAESPSPWAKHDDSHVDTE